MNDNSNRSRSGNTSGNDRSRSENASGASVCELRFDNPNSCESGDQKCDLALIAQADVLLLIADLWRAPEQSDGLFGELDECDLQALTTTTGLIGADVLLERLNTTLIAHQKTLQVEREAVYRALFDGRIGCPINEATFIRRDKGAIIGDLCGFYRAFGWEHAANGERPDHLLIELEFVAMLLVMAAQAKTESQLETTITALADFTRQHPNDWIELFCEQIRTSTIHPYFVAASNLLEQAWNALIQYHDWIVDSLPVNPIGIGAEEPEDPYECGAPDLVTLGGDREVEAPSETAGD